MSVERTCPGCRRPYEVPEHLLGKIVRCPKCAAEFRAPAAAPPGAYADRPEPAPAAAPVPLPPPDAEQPDPLPVPPRRAPDVPDRRSTATWVAIGLAVALLVGVLSVIGFRIVRADRSGSDSKSTATRNWAAAQDPAEIVRREMEEQLLQARMDAVRAAELEAVRAQEEMKAAFDREDFRRRREEELRRKFDLAKEPVALPRGLVAVPNPECLPLEPEDLPRSKASERAVGKAVKQIRDAKVVEIDANGSLGICWDAEGKTFYCLGGGTLRRIALDGLKELRTLKIDSRSSSFAFSSEGPVVSVGCPGGELWVIDADSLEVKRRIALPRSSERQGPAVDWTVSSPNHSVAFADGHHLLAVDLKKGVVTHEYKENGELAHLYLGAMSPDGKYLFREESGELQRIRINGTNLAIEDSSGKIASIGEAISVSPDGQWVCLTSLNKKRDAGASATNIYLVENLRQPFCTIPPCETPRTIGFDPKTGRIYSGNNKCPLEVFDQKGNLVDKYAFAEDYGESLAIVVHPAGNKMLVQTEKKLFLVELDAGREP